MTKKTKERKPTQYFKKFVPTLLHFWIFKIKSRPVLAISYIETKSKSSFAKKKSSFAISESNLPAVWKNGNF